MKRICYIVSDIDKALAFEWIVTELRDDFIFQFILIGKKGSHLEDFLRKNNIQLFVVEDKLHSSYFSRLRKVISLLRQTRPDVVHVHLWRAMLTGLMAAYILRVEKRIFTRHHATIHHISFKSGLKWDKLCNLMATDIIAISENIKEILIEWENASHRKIHMIHHGFDFSYFRQVEDKRVSFLKTKLGIGPEDYPIVGVISRYTSWKGIQYIIPAFRSLLNHYPNAYLLLANAHGDFAEVIKGELSKLPPGRYNEVVFENDIAALYKCFDVFVHVPIDRHVEAFGQTYIEPLIAEVPMIVTLSGVAPEFIKHGQNAHVVDFRSSDQIYDGINMILSDPLYRERLIANGKKSIEKFSLRRFVTSLKDLYNS